MSDPPGAADYFGERAILYDGHYERLDAGGQALRARLAAVVRLVGEGPGELLDAGMGPGRLCAELATRGWTVSGVDASEEMVSVARARLPEAGERLRCAAIETLPFPDASFDVVTATGVLEYADVPRALAELARVVRPAGRAVVSYPNPHALYGVWKSRAWYPAVRGAKRVFRRPGAEMPRGAGGIAPDAFARLLYAAGLEVVETVHVALLAVPSPVDEVFPRASARVACWLERRGRAASLLGTQVVFSAWKVPARG